MRKLMLILIGLILCISFTFAGEFDRILQNFDAELDSTMSGYNETQLYYETNENNNPDSGYSVLTWVDDPVAEGEKAMRWEYSVHNAESWGGYQKLGFSLADSTKSFDFTGYDTLSLMYYVEEPCSKPGRISFRVNLADVAEAPQGDTTNMNTSGEYYYSLTDGLVDITEAGWHEKKIAIENTYAWDGTAFNLTGWAGVVGNAVIDKEHIKSVDIELSISGAGEGDRAHGVILLDRLALTGASTVPYVLFSGVAVKSNLSAFTWGQSSLEFEELTGTDGSNAIKWTMGDEWGNGWTGAGYNIDPPLNMMMSWGQDSLKFGMKVSEGTDTLKFQFEDGAGKKAHLLDPIDDGEWHDYALKLSDFKLEEGDFFDSSAVTVFQFMANGNAVAGNTVMFDYIWTGDPVIDIIPPATPGGVSATPYPSQYYNLVMWQDVDGEDGEVYDVYASHEPIDSVTGPMVEKIADGVLEGTQAVAHYLRYPLEDGQIDYYYAVVCRDAAGNVGEPGFSGKITGTGKGVPTISLNVPDFEADGYLDEWWDAGIEPVVLKPETDYVVVGSMEDSTDLKASVYMAIDDDYLYLAGDVIDDVFYHNDNQDWWTNDALDFFIGLYNQTGGAHQNFELGDEPDHKFQIRANGFTDEVTSGYEMGLDHENYYFEGFDPDYVFEAKISLDSIKTADEDRFYPKNGMKIPIEIYFHDNDDGTTTHESALGWSPNNTDLAWQSPTEWTYTFIGDRYGVVGVEDEKVSNVATTFSLEQNYPNPFNPVTTIEYSIAKAEKVKISVYNVLGQKVDELVNNKMQAGAYKVNWNASGFASGMYFYKIQAGNFVKTRKMLLMK
jgi:hypothetical protein